VRHKQNSQKEESQISETTLVVAVNCGSLGIGLECSVERSTNRDDVESHVSGLSNFKYAILLKKRVVCS